MNKIVPALILTLGVMVFFWRDDGFDPTSIRGKRVLITGGSSGIGEQLAYEYSKLGAKVFITARRLTLLQKVAKKCKTLGALQVEYLISDLGEQNDRDNVIAEVKKRLGGLDHLILNHAIMTPGLWLGNKENMTRLLSDFQVNSLSYVDLSSQALAMLMESKGNIGVVSSVAGKIATAGFVSYCMDKHALQGFFAALRQELLLTKSDISVTTCVIGPVDTELLIKSKEEKKALLDKFSFGYDISSSAEDTAMAIMRGVTNRKYEIYFGKIAWFMVSFHKLFPSYIEDFFGNSSLIMNNLLV